MLLGGIFVMETIFIENSQFMQMKAVKALVENKADQNKTKMSLMSKVYTALEDSIYRLKEATRKSIDRLAFMSTERGFVYIGQETLAKQYGVTARTIRGRIKELIEAGVLAVAYRRSSKHNGKGKPVYFFTAHPYFESWKSMFNLQVSDASISSDFQTDFQAEKADKPTGSKDGEGKKVSTLFDLIPKLRDLINNSLPAKFIDKLRALQGTGVQTADQLKGQQLIENSLNILPTWKDDAFVCSLALPKKMDSIHWTALHNVISDMMQGNQARYGNPFSYFAKCFNNAVTKAKTKARLCTWLDDAPTGIKPKAVKTEFPLIDWINNDLSAMPIKPDVEDDMPY